MCHELFTYTTGNILAVGTDDCTVQLWDCARQRKMRTLRGHSARVSCLAWNNHVVSSGSRDTMVLSHDVRIRDSKIATLGCHTQVLVPVFCYVARCSAHLQTSDSWLWNLLPKFTSFGPQEVCGLKYSPDGMQLASGGNDNKLCIWDVAGARGTVSPRFELTAHTAAVKALGWAPFQKNLLASGGGTQDRTIRFWNTSTGVCPTSHSILWLFYDLRIGCLGTCGFFFFPGMRQQH